MRKGVDIDEKKSLLTFSDGRDPVPVIRDSSMTGNPEQQCWKAMNYGVKVKDYYKERFWTTWLLTTLTKVSN